MKIIYMVHGTTQDNIDHLASGHNDIELAPIGIEQAKKLGSQEVSGFDVIFTSDLKRAVDTASLAFEGRAPILRDKRLRECDYGELTQKPKTWQISEYISKKYPNGESYRDVEARIKAFLIDAKKRFQVIGIVAHQGPQLAIEVITQKKSWEDVIKNDWRNTKSWKPSWTYEF
ncbi:MAG TPA: histidine phosphatase family protein [Acidobacteriota bacterium]|nr:histidine phosphatase family protein [Acidobacteriota bacterium]